MFTLLFINVVLLTLAPQYVTYGNQHYSDIKIYSGSGRHMPLVRVGPCVCFVPFLLLLFHTY